MSDGRAHDDPQVPPLGGKEPRALSSTELFGTDQEIRILHEDQTYRLRITRQGKLILTK